MKTICRGPGPILLLALSVLLLFGNQAVAAELSFGWTPNTDTDLGGYKIYCGKASRTYSNNVDVGLAKIVDGQVQATITAPDDCRYFAATAYSTGGLLESDYSNEVVVKPNVPAKFKRVIR
ncbi:MAG: hypothetical protein ACOY32_15200 [Thermodesulfobacteriota bacterium]